MTECVDQKEQLVNDTCNLFMKFFPNMDIKTLRNALYMSMNDYTVQKTTTDLVVYDGPVNDKLIKMFLVAKKVNGCTNRTIKAYKQYLEFAFDKIQKPADQVTPNDLRLYFAERELKDGLSAVSRDNERRALSSFYTWMVDEEYMTKNPIRKIPFIRGVKQKKKAFTEMELEKIREAVKTPKEKAIVEVLISTGCRASELCHIKVSEINGNKVLLHGKGQKDRFGFLNAKAIIAIQEYMETPYFKKRFEAGNQYLFARERMDSPNIYRCMGGESVNSCVRSIGKRAGVEGVHAHRFRRTTATMALKRGMPIEQVSKMLGHEQLETTQIYLDLDEESLEGAHKKYVV